MNEISEKSITNCWKSYSFLNLDSNHEMMKSINPPKPRLNFLTFSQCRHPPEILENRIRVELARFASMAANKKGRIFSDPSSIYEGKKKTKNFQCHSSLLGILLFKVCDQPFFSLILFTFVLPACPFIHSIQCSVNRKRCSVANQLPKQDIGHFTFHSLVSNVYFNETQLIFYCFWLGVVNFHSLLIYILRVM